MLNQHMTFDKVKQQMENSLNLPLKFYVGNEAINPGYHVTEVKHSAIKALDCGRSSAVERWNEITVQLLDGNQDSKQGYMPTAKFLAIVQKALTSLAEPLTTSFNVEYAPKNGPLRKFRIDSINIAQTEISVSLANEYAVCKPFERVKAAMMSTTENQTSHMEIDKNGCCSIASSTLGNTCCG